MVILYQNKIKNKKNQVLEETLVQLVPTAEQTNGSKIDFETRPCRKTRRGTARWPQTKLPGVYTKLPREHLSEKQRLAGCDEQKLKERINNRLKRVSL